MPRKLFLSFLGTGNYSPVRYFTDDVSQALPPMRFVQEATILLHCQDFSSEDEILIFTTDQAFERSWKERILEDEITGTREVQAGLAKRLEGLELPCRWSNERIPDGQSTEEIWEIFSVIFDKLDVGDHLYIDITHGFRSIPMLNMVLTNYAKLLKGIVVKGIYYGAFDSKSLNEAGESCAPIWDLTSFSELQDWSIAAYSFTKSGNTSEIVELTKAKIAPTLRETKGKDATATALRRLSNNLETMDGSFTTNRGRDILAGKTFSEIKRQLEILKKDKALIKPLRPILESLESKIQHFEAEGPLNWLAGARWCLEHKLIQQGFTQLQEGILTHAISETRGIIQLDYTDYNHREIVKHAFFIKAQKKPSSKWAPAAKNNMLITNCFLKSDIVKHLCEVFVTLSNLRNDINHSGYTNNTSADKFEKNLSALLSKVEDYFNSKN